MCCADQFFCGSLRWLGDDDGGAAADGANDAVVGLVQLILAAASR
jgi:hypothetical protein